MGSRITSIRAGSVVVLAGVAIVAVSARAAAAADAAVVVDRARQRLGDRGARTRVAGPARSSGGAGAGPCGRCSRAPSSASWPARRSTSPGPTRSPAVVWCWLPGQEGGRAIADVLTGVVDPGGRLPCTLAARLEDTPALLDSPPDPGVIRYQEGVFSGHRWYDLRRIEPAFPFGHGLSYTSFSDRARPGLRRPSSPAVRLDVAIRGDEHRRAARHGGRAALRRRPGGLGAAAAPGAEGLREGGARSR